MYTSLVRYRISNVCAERVTPAYAEWAPTNTVVPSTGRFDLCTPRTSSKSPSLHHFDDTKETRENCLWSGMGKTEIESWVASTSSALSDFDGTEKSAIPEWRRDDVLSDWSRAVELAQKTLLTSSTKKRVHFLREELLFVAKHIGESSDLFIFQAFTEIYVRSDLASGC